MCNAASHFFLIDNKEFVTGFGQAVKTLNFHGHGRTGGFDFLALVVEHGANFTEVNAADEAVTLIDGTLGDEHGTDRTASFVELGFDNVAASVLVRIGLEFQNFSLKEDHFEQFVQTGLLLGRDMGEDGVTAPVFGNEALFGQFSFDVVRIGSFLINFVDCDHDRNAGSLGVADASRVWSMTPSSAATTRMTMSVTCAPRIRMVVTLRGRSIEEHDFAAIRVDVVRTDVLRDAACFAVCHMGETDGVEQGGFTVVNMTHDSDHRWAAFEVFFLVSLGGNQEFLFVKGDVFDFVAEFAGKQGGSIQIKGLVDGRHDAHCKQSLDEVLCLGTHLVSHIGEANGLVESDFALGGLHGLGDRLFNLLHLLLASFFLRPLRPCGNPLSSNDRLCLRVRLL